MDTMAEKFRSKILISFTIQLFQKFFVWFASSLVAAGITIHAGAAFVDIIFFSHSSLAAVRSNVLKSVPLDLSIACILILSLVLCFSISRNYENSLNGIIFSTISASIIAAFASVFPAPTLLFFIALTKIATCIFCILFSIFLSRRIVQ